jgi:hypothetical protein
MYCESDSTRSPYSLEVNRIQTVYHEEIHRLDISAHKLLRINMLILENNHDITSYAVSCLINNSWPTHLLSELLCSCQKSVTSHTQDEQHHTGKLNTKLQ